MRHLKLDAIVGQMPVVFAPVELERLAGPESQRHEHPAPGCALRNFPLRPPLPDKGRNPPVGAVITQGDQVRIKRDSDSATEVIGATMPLVLSVTDQTGEARYPSFKGIMAAKKKPMETYSLSDLGVDAEKVGLSVSWTTVEETSARPPRTAGEIVKDEDGSGAPALAGFLASKKFI